MREYEHRARTLCKCSTSLSGRAVVAPRPLGASCKFYIIRAASGGRTEQNCRAKPPTNTDHSRRRGIRKLTIEASEDWRRELR
jgi:hypothetical protein